MTNLAAAPADTACRYPHRPIVRLDDLLLTYDDLWTLSGEAAEWLRRRGVLPGDRVGLMLPNVPTFPVLYYGILRPGGVVVPMNPLLKRREVRHYLADSAARLVFVSPLSGSEAAACAADLVAEPVTVTDQLVAEIAREPASDAFARRADDDDASSCTPPGPPGRRKARS